MNPGQLKTRGEGNPSHKLTEQQVREIRALLKRPPTWEEISKRFGICKTTIHRIKTGKNWRHVMD